MISIEITAVVLGSPGLLHSSYVLFINATYAENDNDAYNSDGKQNMSRRCIEVKW